MKKKGKVLAARLPPLGSIERSEVSNAGPMTPLGSLDQI